MCIPFTILMLCAFSALNGTIIKFDSRHPTHPTITRRVALEIRSASHHRRVLQTELQEQDRGVFQGDVDLPAGQYLVRFRINDASWEIDRTAMDVSVDGNIYNLVGIVDGMEEVQFSRRIDRDMFRIQIANEEREYTAKETSAGELIDNYIELEPVCPESQTGAENDAQTSVPAGRVSQAAGIISAFATPFTLSLIGFDEAVQDMLETVFFGDDCLVVHQVIGWLFFASNIIIMPFIASRFCQNGFNRLQYLILILLVLLSDLFFYLLECMAEDLGANINEIKGIFVSIQIIVFAASVLLASRKD